MARSSNNGTAAGRLFTWALVSVMGVAALLPAGASAAPAVAPGGRPGASARAAPPSQGAGPTRWRPRLRWASGWRAGA